MKKLFLEVFIVLFISFLLIEISAVILIKSGYLPNGITPRVTLVPDKKFGFWHHKNRTFKLASPCWNSKVSYNNYGMRNSLDTKLIKKKKRIAIMGDSMSENLEVSDGKDFGSLLQSKLPDFEVLNFSTRSTGLGDQLELYKGLAKNFDLDHVFLFISDNDFEDNYYLNSRPSQNKYKIENNVISKIEIDKNFFISQKKFINKLKKEDLVFVKEYLNSYILYSHIVAYIKYKIYKKQPKINLIETDAFKDYEEKKKIYSYLVKNFKEALSNNEKLHVFVNLRPKIISQKFYPEKKNIEEMSKIWGSQIINPINEGINFLKSKKKYNEPFFSFSCDGHYSELGAKFMANFVSNYFLNN